jgi:hypothetical protein
VTPIEAKAVDERVQQGGNLEKRQEAEGTVYIENPISSCTRGAGRESEVDVWPHSGDSQEEIPQ